MQTLVLDNEFNPVRIAHFKDIVADLLTGKFIRVKEYDDPSKVVRSVNITVKLPAVVAYMTGSEGRRKGVRFSRENIWLRDTGRCAYCSTKCSKKEFTLDHVTPRSKGGKTSWDNVVVCCIPCNQRKGDKSPAEARMKLRITPVKPAWLPPTSFSLVYEKGIPKEIRQFLRDLRYWNGELEQDE